MMTRTILFHSEKGGTGKTTLACLYAAYRAVLGDRVLLIDADGQGHATMTFGLDDAPGVFDVMVRSAAVESRWVRPMLETWVPPGYDPAGSLHVLPGNARTYMVPMIVGFDEEMSREVLGDFKQALDDAPVDLVLFDTGPSGGGLMTILWDVADGVVIPTLLDPLSAAATIQTVARARSVGVPVLGVVPNMTRLETILHQSYLADLQGMDLPVMDPIANRIEWAEASHVRTQLYTVQAAMSKARQEALRFCEQMDRLNPALVGGEGGV